MQLKLQTFSVHIERSSTSSLKHHSDINIITNTMTKRRVFAKVLSIKSRCLLFRSCIDVEATLYLRHVPAVYCLKRIKIICRQTRLNPLCRVDSATSTLWTSHFLIEGVSGSFSLLLCFIEIPVFNAKSVDPDQTPRSVASDLGLHCLHESFLWDSRH